MNKIYYSYIFFSMFVASACNKFLDIKPPVDSATTATVFENEITALSAVKGLYVQVRASSGILNSALSLYPGVGSDEFFNPTNLASIQSFYTHTLLNNNNTTYNMWINSYQYIYIANAILNGLQQSPNISQITKDGFRGEVLYIRSLVYFYLVNLFGDVPLVLTSDYLESSRLARTAQETVYKQVVTDLLEAQSLLPATATNANTRVSKMAVSALLARVYLYLQQWENAEQSASLVINSGFYRLEADLNKIFLATSPETIFQISRPNTNTSEGTAFIPSSATTLPAYAATEYLLNAFEPNDARKSSWLKINTVSGKQYYYPYKYKVRSSTTSIENNIIQRLAEVVLIRAEARVELGRLTTALDDLNIIRNRAGLQNANTSSQAELIIMIAAERQKELFAEWGHRWFDLKRTHKINVVLSVRKAPNWAATDSLYPVPISQINANPSLTQNPGYE